MTRPPALLLSLLLPIIPACTDEASDKADDTGSDSGDSSGALDLDNCTTDIADGVPAYALTDGDAMTDEQAAQFDAPGEAEPEQHRGPGL